MTTPTRTLPYINPASTPASTTSAPVATASATNPAPRSAWETVDDHWHNDKRRMVMQQREHTRYHSAWAKLSTALRQTRRPTADGGPRYEGQRQRHLKDRVKESQVALDYDRHCHSQDLDNFVKKFHYLKTFRDDNKQEKPLSF
ncbi:hypothetical protein ACOMHN_056157 [Nucella lapillus]